MLQSRILGTGDIILDRHASELPELLQGADIVSVRLVPVDWLLRQDPRRVRHEHQRRRLLLHLQPYHLPVNLLLGWRWYCRKQLLPW